MAVLIPSMGSCVSRMTSGERRLAERLEQKLDDDYQLGTTCRWSRNTCALIFRSCIPVERAMRVVAH